jgi:hypothetical protein
MHTFMYLFLQVIHVAANIIAIESHVKNNENAWSACISLDSSIEFVMFSTDLCQNN